jgi:sRNA-binding carbon storage regulator CsrA
VEGNKVRLGIDAPRSVRVDRKEIHDRRILEATNEPMLIITNLPSKSPWTFSSRRHPHVGIIKAQW